MPDFFLISGLFLAARIDRPWREYLDTKVVHFAYFYVLWLHILLAVKAPTMIAEMGAAGFLTTYVASFVDPFSSLWFIYLLAVYFVVAKLCHGLPKPAVLAGAALLHVAWPETGVFLADEFASRFVFFYAGYALAQIVFGFAGRISQIPAAPVLAALVLWAALNALAVGSGWSGVKGLDLAFSFAGIAAVIAASVLLTRVAAGGLLAYCGRNSISIYLAFTLFMGPLRAILLKIGPTLPGEAVAIASMAAGVLGALALSRIVSGTSLGFLFERPRSMGLPALMARLAGSGASTPQARARFESIAAGR
jgi:uncharacterized membrane protein YcfT